MPEFFTSVYIPSDLSSEAKSLIEKHQAKRSNKYIWYEELGKDLVNYIEHPDLIYEVFRQLAYINRSYLFLANAKFIESLNENQIQNLLKTKQGIILTDNLQLYLNPANNPADANKLRQLYMKIERLRVPIIVQDKRPYVGDMVGANEDFGIDPSIASGRAPYSFRFGSGHDGEHWLTKTVGAQVKATSKIKGIVLTYYYQGNGVWNVMILLDNTQIVMLFKDLTSLGPKIKQAPVTTPDNRNTHTKDESRFTDKTGNPISKIKLNDGDVIGTTMSWKVGLAKTYYPGYDREFGTFHFAFLKYEKVQEYRSNVSTADGVTDDEDIAKLKELGITALPLSWFIPALSPISPVKCFK